MMSTGIRRPGLLLLILGIRLAVPQKRDQLKAERR